MGLELNIRSVGDFVDVDDFKKEFESIQTYIKVRGINFTKDYIMYLWVVVSDNGFIFNDDLEEQLLDVGFNEDDLLALHHLFIKLSDAFNVVSDNFKEKTGLELNLDYDEEEETYSIYLDRFDVHELLVKHFGKGVQVV